jgi:hypothetical protein
VQTIGIWTLLGAPMIPNFLLVKLMRLSFFNFYPVVFFVVLLSIYITHFFCWHLGLMYRAHHDVFPWVLQRHEKKPRKDAMSQLELQRAAQRRREVAKIARANRERAGTAMVDGQQIKISNVRTADQQPPREMWQRVRDAADAPPEDTA